VWAACLGASVVCKGTDTYRLSDIPPNKLVFLANSFGERTVSVIRSLDCARKIIQSKCQFSEVIIQVCVCKDAHVKPHPRRQGGVYDGAAPV